MLSAATGQAVSLRDEQWEVEYKYEDKYKTHTERWSGEWSKKVKGNEMETCINPVELAFTEMESEKQGKEATVKVEDKHSLVFFICAWLGVGVLSPS